MSSHLVDGDPPLGGDLETSVDQVVQLSTHSNSVPQRRATTDLGFLGGGEGRFAGDEDTEEDTERPDFGFGGVVLVTGDDFCEEERTRRGDVSSNERARTRRGGRSCRLTGSSVGGGTEADDIGEEGEQKSARGNRKRDERRRRRLTTPCTFEDAPDPSPRQHFQSR